VQDADDASRPRFADESTGVGFRLSRVDDNRAAHFSGERYLCGKRSALRLARRVVIVVVEAALPNRDRRTPQKLTETRDVAPLVKGGRIVRMDSSGRKHKPGILGRELSRERRYVERLSDADDGHRARVAGAGDYRVAVAGEGRVREVGVAVDEDLRAPAWRGHLRSIQRSTGAAT
jgi:hypothetical protein